jgi:hypothetical protein
VISVAGEYLRGRIQDNEALLLWKFEKGFFHVFAVESERSLSNTIVPDKSQEEMPEGVTLF